MTVFRPDVSLPVEAQGTLRLDAPTGRSLELVADGTILRLDLPGWAELRTMIPRSFGARARAIRSLANLLDAFCLELSLEYAGKPFFGLGHNADSNWLARVLGLAPAHISLSAIRLFVKR